MVCMSEVTEWEIPLEKIENKMEKKIILVHEDTCVHQRTPLIYTLNKNILYLGGLQMWTIEKYFCGTSTKKYWALVGAVTNNRKYSHIWKLCLWHPLNDNQTYFILSNNQIWHFLYCSKHSCPLVSEGDWFHDHPPLQWIPKFEYAQILYIKIQYLYVTYTHLPVCFKLSLHYW